MTACRMLQRTSTAVALLSSVGFPSDLRTLASIDIDSAFLSCFGRKERILVCRPLFFAAAVAAAVVTAVFLHSDTRTGGQQIPTAVIIQSSLLLLRSINIAVSYVYITCPLNEHHDTAVEPEPKPKPNRTSLDSSMVECSISYSYDLPC